MRQTFKIEISYRTIVFAVLLLAGLYLLTLITDILLLLFVAIILTVAINPLVSRLESHGVPRTVSIALVYLLIIVVFAALVAAILPPLVSQITSLVSQIDVPSQLIADLRLSTTNLENLQILANQVNSIPKLFSVVGQAFNLLIIILTLFVISFYMLLERKNLHKHLIWLFGKNQSEKEAEHFINTFERQVGGWVRAELTLILFVAFFTFLILTILNIPYALPLAILAGLLELLPNIGPTLAAIPAIIIAYITTSPEMAIAVLVAYIVIQQVQNSFLIPYVMRRTVNIHPIITILLLLVGFRLGSVTGAVLAIPLYLAIKTSVGEWYRHNHGSEPFRGVVRK
jgi:predicted PurR-regulated permease PerM